MKLIDVFMKHCDVPAVTNDFIDKIIRFDMAFVTKNDDHIHFFGSGLTGDRRVVFTDTDRDAWLDDILRADEYGLMNDIPHVDYFVKLKKEVKKGKLPTVMTNHFNLGCIYLLHHLAKNKGKVSNDKLEAGMMSVLNVLQYRFFTSLLNEYFQYLANPDTAKATFQALSQRFILRQEGNWANYFRARSKSFLEGIHHKTYTTFDDDKRIGYMVTDIQTRTRNTLKEIYAKFDHIYRNNKKGITTSTILNTEEGIVLKDVTREYSALTRHIAAVIPEYNNFVKPDLVDVVVEIAAPIDRKAFLQTLGFVSNVYVDRTHTYTTHIASEAITLNLEEYVNEVMLFAFDLIQRKRIATTNLPLIAKSLKSMYTGSLVDAREILIGRSIGDQIVREAVSRKATVPTSPERNGLMLYIVLRALTMKHYT